MIHECQNPIRSKLAAPPSITSCLQVGLIEPTALCLAKEA